MVMETMRLVKEMNLTPKRTIRCVLFMNEENGLNGDARDRSRTSFLIEAGVPGFSFVPEPLHYFDYHHTPAGRSEGVGAGLCRGRGAGVDPGELECSVLGSFLIY